MSNVERNAQLDEMLNECYGEFTIMGCTFSAADILYALDEVAYRCAVADEESFNEEEEEEEESDDDEDESDEEFFWYLINDEPAGARVIDWFNDFQKACDAAKERYKTMGLKCHVEGEGDKHLYNPKHEDDFFDGLMGLADE